mmetsp:Transcript_49384/g.148761  ORF Transcript_49384/g.148761 Transcript_49384/m.148761 type:complete len:206 (-) Transcript_49384:1986-2603(-)
MFGILGPCARAEESIPRLVRLPAAAFRVGLAKGALPIVAPRTVRTLAALQRFEAGRFAGVEIIIGMMLLSAFVASLARERRKVRSRIHNHADSLRIGTADPHGGIVRAESLEEGDRLVGVEESSREDLASLVEARGEGGIRGSVGGDYHFGGGVGREGRPRLSRLLWLTGLSGRARLSRLLRLTRLSWLSRLLKDLDVRRVEGRQ